MKGALSAIATLVTVVTLLGAGQAAGVVDLSEVPGLAELRTGTPDVIGQPVPPRGTDPYPVPAPVYPGPAVTVDDGVQVPQAAPTGPKGTESERTEPMVGLPVQGALMQDDNPADFCRARVEVALHYQPQHGAAMAFSVPAGTYLQYAGPQVSGEWVLVVVNGVQGWVWGLDCK